jgi:hypothetical protein
MKKSLILAFFYCGTCFAYDIRLPIWEQMDYLVCEGIVNYSCDMKANCGKLNSTARWEVNFKNAEIVYIGASDKEKINGRYFKYNDQLNKGKNVILIDGRLMSFVGDSKGEQFVAVTSGVSNIFGSVSTQNTYFVCEGKK